MEAWRSRWSGVRLSSAATRGRKLVMASSWKLETSTTFTVSSPAVSTSEMSGVPMLPPTCVRRPASPKILPSSAVVVVLPFEPVTATTVPRRKRQASSSSEMISIPFPRAWTRAGSSSGTPGLKTMRSAARKSASSWPAHFTLTPRARRAAASAATADSGLSSLTVTRAPRAARKRAAAAPVRASPTTSAFRSFSSIVSSPQLQRAQGEQRENQRGNPETDDDLRLLPPDELEVVVERGHAEDAPAGQLEGADLQDHRQRLQDEHAADEEKQDLLLDDDGHGADGAAEGARADVAHEDFRGVGVVAKDAEGGAGHGGAEDGQLALLGHLGEVEVLGELGVAADVGERGEGAGGDGHAADGEPVQAVGEVDRVRRAHQHQHDEDDEGQRRQRQRVPAVQQRINHQVGPQLLEKGEQDVRRVERAAQGEQHAGNHHRGQHLERKLGLGAQAQAAAVDRLQVVVGEADSAVSHQGEERQPEERVGQVRPQQRGNHDGGKNQQAAHGGRARLGLVAGDFFADELADLEGAQPADHPGAEHQHQQQRREPGEGGAHRDVAEDIERGEVRLEPLVEEVVEHAYALPAAGLPRASSTRGSSAKRFFNASSTVSSATPRDAFSNTQSPAWRISPSQSVAASLVSKKRARAAGIPAAVAASTRWRASPVTPARKSMLPNAAIFSPASRCNSAEVGPSSFISPATKILRRAPGVRLKASAIAARARGFEL